MADTPRGAFLTPEQLALIEAQQASPPQMPSGAFVPNARFDPELGLTNVPPEEPAPAPEITTGSILASMPRRMMAADADTIARKRLYGVPLSPEEESAVAASDRYKQEVGEPAARNAIGEISGIAPMARGAETMKQGYDEGSPLTMAAGGAEALRGAIPGLSLVGKTAPLVNAMYSSMPRAAAVGGALAVPGAFLASEEASAARTADQVRQELSRMSPAEIKAHQQRLGLPADGVAGPATIAATVEADRQADAAQKAALEAARQGKEIEGDNAAKLKAAEIEAGAKADAARARAAAELARDTKLQAAKEPLRNLFPEVMPAVPVLSGILGGALGGYIKGRGVGTHQSELDDLSKRVQRAIKSGNKPLATKLNTSLMAAKDAGPGGTLPAIAASAGTGAEISMLPDEIDAYRGVAGVNDIPSILARGGMGALIGATPGLVASKYVAARDKKYTPSFGADVAAMPAKAKATSQASQARQLVDEASRLAPPSAPGTVAGRAQSPDAGSSLAGPSPAAAPRQLPASELRQNQPSLTSGPDPLVYASQANNTKAASAAQEFVPGVPGVPKAGATSAQLSQDAELVKKLQTAADEAGKSKVTANVVRDVFAADNREIGSSTANTLARRINAARERELERTRRKMELGASRKVLTEE